MRRRSSAANGRIPWVSEGQLLRESATDGGYLLGVALEARLFGRLRLLTLQAVVDVVERPTPWRAADDGGVASERLPIATGRRSEAEALLREAEDLLHSMRGDQAAH